MSENEALEWQERRLAGQGRRYPKRLLYASWYVSSVYEIHAFLPAPSWMGKVSSDSAQNLETAKLVLDNIGFEIVAF